MIRRLALLAFILTLSAISGCSTAADYHAGQNGQFASQNLWPTDRETRAGQN